MHKNESNDWLQLRIADKRRDIAKLKKPSTDKNEEIKSM